MRIGSRATGTRARPIGHDALRRHETPRKPRASPALRHPVTDALLDLMIDAAIAAADEILAVYAEDFEATHKSDGSPVTAADSRAEAVILERLAPTGLPVLAEESAAAGHIPELDGRFFVVDPLDGTKEFLKRNGEFTVNIALVENGAPTHGVVLAPVTGRLYAAEPGRAFSATVDRGAIGGTHPLRTTVEGPVRIVASRSHGHAALAEL